ncbi:MAG: DegT/DnrJ/EryC1/StrS family aminotransferase, partial [Gammaproteobacteria bacterium]
IKDMVGDSVFVLEDAAQGYGGILKRQRAGGMGHASVVSFGDGKLLDCGGGGALLCDDTDFADRCREIVTTLSDDASEAALNREQVMKQMMATRKKFRSDRAELIRNQREILQKYRNGYLTSCRPAWVNSIQQALLQLDAIIQSRKNLMEQLDEVLGNLESVRLPSREGSPALWRYSFLLDQFSRNEKIKELKEEGLMVSRLFSPCAKKFSEKIYSLPVSEGISESIVNLQIPRSHSENDEFVSIVKKVFV